jgi:hypothetical protein
MFSTTQVFVSDERVYSDIFDKHAGLRGKSGQCQNLKSRKIMGR